MANSDFFIAVEAAGTGVHPASWRRADSRAEQLFTGGYWAEILGAAETAGADAILLPDSFALQPGGPGATRGVLDAVAIAARVAARTSRIGLLPQASVTHTEPFHLSKAIASLDFATPGRAGWEVTVSEGADQATAFGRKDAQDDASLWHEADEAIEVVTRLWDSWEDDAEIRDLATGRFIDRDKLHYIDFEGDNFSVRGPSITPRSPQGQPIVVVRADSEPATAVAVRRADLIRIAATDLEQSEARRSALRNAILGADRDPDAVHVLLDIDIHLADTVDAAYEELAQLDRWQAAEPGGLRHIGTVDTLRDLLSTITTAHADGVVLRPLALATTVDRLAAAGPAVLRSGHELRTTTEPLYLRERLGLARPDSRYADAREGVPS